MPADMWALGITLYSFLFGDVPFKARGCATAGRHRGSAVWDRPAWLSAAGVTPLPLCGPAAAGASTKPKPTRVLHHPSTPALQGRTLDELYEAIQTQEPQYPPDVPIRWARTGRGGAGHHFMCLQVA